MLLVEASVLCKLQVDAAFIWVAPRSTEPWGFNSLKAMEKSLQVKRGLMEGKIFGQCEKCIIGP